MKKSLPSLLDLGLDSTPDKEKKHYKGISYWIHQERNVWVCRDERINPEAHFSIVGGTDIFDVANTEAAIKRAITRYMETVGDGDNGSSLCASFPEIAAALKNNEGIAGWTYAELKEAIKRNKDVGFKIFNDYGVFL